MPHQFLDTSSNTRNDLWGGPHPAPRARFTLEVVRALIEVWGCDRVGVKLSPAGGLGDVGMGLKETVETYTYLITELDKMKVIYVTLVRYVERMDVWIEGAKNKNTIVGIPLTHHSRRPSPLHATRYTRHLPPPHH